eukprot:COSAG04_NODE_63_length_30038_cov_9.461071_3_plen_103_part_00
MRRWLTEPACPRACSFILAADSAPIKLAWVNKLKAAVEAIAPLSPAESAVWAGVSKSHAPKGGQGSVQRTVSDETSMWQESEDMLMMVRAAIKVSSRMFTAS